MKKILLLSDTHGYVDERILSYASQADQVWHCGDFGTMQVVEEIEKVAPLKGVFGNVDDARIRQIFPEVNRFQCEETEVLMIHIGGYPGKYTPLTKKEIAKGSPQIFISGHSHILKIMYDRSHQLLHINPGAAGRYGWHKKRTMVRFEIDQKEIQNMEVIELA